MARKDLIEALQELEQRRRQASAPEVVTSEVAAPGAVRDGGSGQDGNAGRDASGGAAERAPSAARGATPIERAAPEPTPAAGPKLERVDQPTVEPVRPVHERVAAGAPVGLAVLVQPVALAALVLAFAVGYLFGTGRGDGAGTAAAVARQDPRTPGGASPAANGGAPSVPLDVAVERALADPANLFTIQAISYDDTQSKRELATATAGALRAAGLPAADPRRSGRYVVVVVGAAPTREELVELRDRVRAMPDLTGEAGAFAGARITEIDRLFAD